ncbi:hypothetical protein ACVXHB_12635 [Escherichia coli]
MATVNKQAIAAAFGRAAAHYEQHADLQRQSADALLAMLPQRKYTRRTGRGLWTWLDEAASWRNVTRR